MDEQILNTQKWLNKTYGGVTGYTKAPENGNTGWPTIYALREGLQHELGISPVSSGFGDATYAAVEKAVSSWKEGYSGNIVSLIKGAFWAKGISTLNSTNKYDIYLTAAVKSLQTDAGVTANGVLTADLIKALFDMSAFTLVRGGSAEIRGMQQFLNGKYNRYFGILPCDGIYQRDTNTALIYALQAEIGMGEVANGFYGPGTVRNTPTLNVGDTGGVVKVLQYALLANQQYNGPFDGVFSADVGNHVLTFRKFMNLPPFNATADLDVIKGLLTSNGNVNRDASAMDTSKQLTLSDIQTLKANGYSTIGRYLTGSVGVGADRRDKYLTRAEINNITANGMNVFPIYQDGGWSLDYFTASQGVHDAQAARQAAHRLGFPAGTIIYFAADLDIEDGNIAGTIMPYIKAVFDNLSTYKVGIYGTRNVCSHASALGYASASFVADMSTGFSGNLGFPMPENWAFDQFVEFTLAGIPIDNLGQSGKDSGVNKFNSSISVQEALHKILGNIDITLDGPAVVIPAPGNIVVKAQATSHVNTAEGSHIINITNGGFDYDSLQKTFQEMGINLPTSLFETTLNSLGFSISATIGDATISFTGTPEVGKSFEITVNILSLKDDAVDSDFGIKFTIDKFPDFGSGSEVNLGEKLDALLKGLQNALRPNISNDNALLTVISVLFVVVGIGFLFFA